MHSHRLIDSLMRHRIDAGVSQSELAEETDDQDISIAIPKLQA
jgi:hypothetical protein